MFKLNAPFPPKGDQPKAIKQLTEGIKKAYNYQTLLGVTGSGKTYTMANIIANLNKPTLVISHNKTLAAQLCSEFKEFFPENAVEYFVSYYDYYQPEAYIPQTDTYIEKDSSINDEIDRLRLKATTAVLARKDVIVVASVSCIYGLGTPVDYKKTILFLKKGDTLDRDFILNRLIQMQYNRNQVALKRGQFRLQGETLEIYPADQDEITRVSFLNDTVEKIIQVSAATGEIKSYPERSIIYPAKHFIISSPKLQTALKSIKEELNERLGELKAKDKILEAQRLKMRTEYDLELLTETGYCNGIENYSRHLSGRAKLSPPATLLDYFSEDFLTFIDESHVSVPQIRGMLLQDKSRKKNLIEHGFRLKSACDNRPLSFEEFKSKVGPLIFVSATPADYERKISKQISEQIIRPTGLVDPRVIVKPITGQVDDLMTQIKERTKKHERILVTTLTKRMAEDLARYLADNGIKVRYLHSEIDTLERIQILRDLRLGKFDCLIGINLLREGLDLPEVSLVSILDADKEGFLRSEVSLIQTMGRAARNVSGTVVLYADKITKSIKKAITETSRRRQIQLKYNKTHNITPESIRKSVRDILETTDIEISIEKTAKKEKLSVRALEKLIKEFEKAMSKAAKNLEFEKAAALRDEMWELKKYLKEKMKTEFTITQG